MKRNTLPPNAPTGASRYLAAVVFRELGGVADYQTVVTAVACRLTPRNARSRAINAVQALIHRGCIERDGEMLRLLVMPGQPLTPAELEERKRATAARRHAKAHRHVERIPPPEDQDEDDITLGVGKFALWSPRSVLCAEGGLAYLTWFASRSMFRERHRDAYRAVCWVLHEHFKHEAQRP